MTPPVHCYPDSTMPATEGRSPQSKVAKATIFPKDSLQLIRRFRLPALFCALAVLVCELISGPYTTMGICDDGPYILVAKNLASTGHIVYNGWSEAMLGWQVYLGAAFIKLFGFSFTAVRMSNLFIAMALAFVLQRIMVRAAISERNATIATLAFVLSPLYLMLSVTFMTDITGLFGIVLCLYGCLRALQATSSRAAIGWLCFAVATNAVCGTSRQLAWLGVLVMVPSTLWLLRAQRRVLLAGSAAIFAGVLFILYALHWFQLQPYTEHAGAFAVRPSVAYILRQLIKAFLEVPFLLLPLVALLLPELRRARARVLVVLILAYLLLTFPLYHAQHLFLLEPILGDWLGIHGIYEYPNLQGYPPIFLNTGVQVLLTVVSIGGLLGLTASFLPSRKTPLASPPAGGLSWKQLGTVLTPFSIAYIILLILVVSRAAAAVIVDRYLLGLAAIAALCLVRYYQDHIQPQLPLVSLLLVSTMAVLGVTMTHNLFALYRGRVAIAAELRAAGIPDTAVNNGLEYNLNVELQHAKYINDSSIRVPANSYVQRPGAPDETCPMTSYYNTIHIYPLYAISFDPNACLGPAPFAPVHYSRWLASQPGTLYVVRSPPPSKP
jgi:hypothetical protein